MAVGPAPLVARAFWAGGGKPRPRRPGLAAFPGAGAQKRGNDGGTVRAFTRGLRHAAIAEAARLALETGKRHGGRCVSIVFSACRHIDGVGRAQWQRGSRGSWPGGFRSGCQSTSHCRKTKPGRLRRWRDVFRPCVSAGTGRVPVREPARRSEAAWSHTWPPLFCQAVGSDVEQVENAAMHSDFGEGGALCPRWNLRVGASSSARAGVRHGSSRLAQLRSRRIAIVSGRLCARWQELFYGVAGFGPDGSGCLPHRDVAGLAVAIMGRERIDDSCVFVGQGRRRDVRMASLGRPGQPGRAVACVAPPGAPGGPRGSRAFGDGFPRACRFRAAWPCRRSRAAPAPGPARRPLAKPWMPPMAASWARSAGPWPLGGLVRPDGRTWIK